jgi:hypothetical protein
MGRVQEEELLSPVARGGPRVVPVVLVARLSVDREVPGRGVGGELLWDALTRASAANTLAAARAIVVDAIDERVVLHKKHTHHWQPRSMAVCCGQPKTSTTLHGLVKVQASQFTSFDWTFVCQGEGRGLTQISSGRSTYLVDVAGRVHPTIRAPRDSRIRAS